MPGSDGGPAKGPEGPEGGPLPQGGPLGPPEGAPAAPGRRRLRAAISIILTLLFAAGLWLYVSSHMGEFRELASRPLPKARVALLALSVFLAYFVNSELVRRAFLAHGVRIPVLENLALGFATSAANYFLPFKGATGLRALYLSRRLGLRLQDFVTQLLLVSVLSMGLSSAFALLGLALVRIPDTGAFGPGVPRILALYFLLVLALAVASVAFGAFGIRPPRFLRGLAESWDRYRRAPRLFLGMLALDLLWYLCWCAANWFALSSFGARLGLSETFLYTSLQIHALLINITPAGLGVAEAFGVFAGQALDFGAAEALLAQGLSRVSAICVLCVFGLLGWAYLARLGGPPNTAGKKPNGDAGTNDDANADKIANTND